MLNIFGKKHKKAPEEIKRYKDAIKMINFFMATYDWEKVKQAIDEIREKEISWYKELIQKISDDERGKYGKQAIIKQKNIYDKRITEFDSLELKLNNEKRKYDDKIEKERFKIRFKTIKEQLKKLIATNKNETADNLLWTFLKENQDKKIVIDFYNKEKIAIQKSKDRQKKKEKAKLRQDIKLEALKLIWANIKIGEKKENKEEENKEKSFFERISDKLNLYKAIKKKLKNKKLLDEISLLIEEDSKVKNEIASQKLENIHKWLVKEISQDNINWYDFYWKILWADKISGDTFGFSEEKEKYNFFIWDATGHGIRAWFIVTLLSRLFNQFVGKKNLQELSFEINNWLKQDLKNRNFITWVFFEIEKKEIWKINYVGMWHEPMFIYRIKSKKTEKLIPGWLAAGIRLIKEKENIKVKDFTLENWDILFTYSDWITESKSETWEFYWMDRLEQIFKEHASVWNLKAVYEAIIKDVKEFKWWSNFGDDVTVLLMRRNTEKDIIDEQWEYLQDLFLKWKISKSDMKRIKWKTKLEIEEELRKIAKEKKTQNIIKSLEILYYTWETLRLKQEAIRFIKEWYIDRKINFYLKKAIANEEKYKIKQKEDRVKNKYNVLVELLKKDDLNTVIKEAEDIIWKDWNI